MARDMKDSETAVHETAGAKRVVRKRPRLDWQDSAGSHSAVIEQRTLIGSAAHADIVVGDVTVSRLHAELEPRRDGLWIRDVGSRNGTHVEGVQVVNARVPEAGVFRLGAVVFKVNAAPVERNVELWAEERFGPLLGRSTAMRELFATIARIASMDSTVLIQGESGTGKELVARALHEASPRASQPLVVVDCAALSEQFLQAELFGHARGAFTGAHIARAGAIEAAAGGTVFLDEIGELPLSMQPNLLRVLESRTVRRLGETNHRSVAARFVSATHRDLRAMVNAGAFREDLYFRLAVLPITIPPLRDRMEDIALLLEQFLPDLAGSQRDELLAELLDRPWLGNVRELRNFVERAVAFGTRQALVMSPPSVAPETATSGSPEAAALERALQKPFREFRDDVEREYVQRLLRIHGGNATAAAQAAGIDRTYIYRLIRKYER